MKKILLSTTMLALFAGAASAEVTLSGTGRFGLDYAENRGGATELNEVQLNYRLRINVDAKFEADNGVTYGGRIRFQDRNGDGGAAFSPAMLYVEASGVRVEVGNANTAFDSVALMYNPEIGFQERSFGDPLGSYYSFNSGPYGFGENNRVGIYAAYSVSGVNLKASFIQPDQSDTDSGPAGQDEMSIAADYQADQFAVAAAYVKNGLGIEDNDQTFVGVAYKFSDIASVGLNYNDNGDTSSVGGGEIGSSYTLYGNYTINGIGLAAYVSDLDVDGADTAYGLGATYDLGGATLAGAIESGFDGNMRGDLGVRMSF
ncbi:MAG: porin [Cypionkella sp.]|uniref:porin n=1 Tax=Cypionkella sp. TaxID=2811411 RepID=UPI0026328F5B|nr:porin [Cypionkella sp.]MDB5657950.1 porin [Cypionkella sp.]